MPWLLAICKTKREKKNQGREKLGSTMRRNVTSGGKTRGGGGCGVTPSLCLPVCQRAQTTTAPSSKGFGSVWSLAAAHNTGGILRVSFLRRRQCFKVKGQRGMREQTERVLTLDDVDMMGDWGFSNLNVDWTASESKTPPMSTGWLKMNRRPETLDRDGTPAPSS